MKPQQTHNFHEQAQNNQAARNSAETGWIPIARSFIDRASTFSGDLLRMRCELYRGNHSKCMTVDSS